MNELQQNSKNNLIQTLECLASTKEQLNYKKSVPFVHIPYELICQWDSHFIKDKEWFKKIWTSQEWEVLSSFNDSFNRICQKIPNKNFQDVPDVLTNPNWLQVISAAKFSLESITRDEKSKNQ